MSYYRSSLLAVLLTQLPIPSQAAGAQPQDADHDIIELRAGERLTGEIIKETPDYIELRIGLGTVVGFGKNRVVRIIRASHTKSKKKVAPPALRPTDGWYLLHDGEGHCVGRLHETVQITDRGDFRISEDWQFTTLQETTEITLLEVVDRKLTPISCFYHERKHVASSRKLTHERLVQGRIESGKLIVQRRSLTSRERRIYPFPRGTGLRLTLLHELRNNPNQRIHEAFEDIYDPVREEFYRLRVASKPRRKVEWKGRFRQVRELQIHVRDVTNVEWIDTERRTIRREVNGLHLVATPVASEPDAQKLVLASSASALVQKEGFPYALWMPNPTWRGVTTEPGQLRLEAPLYDASVSLFELDQLDDAEAIATAADALERWLKLSLGQKLRVLGRHETTVRGKPARRLELSYHNVEPGKATPFRCRAYVFRPEKRWVVLCCIAPRDDFAQLKTDFDRISASVELGRKGFAPIVKGPLGKKVAKQP